MERRQRRDCTAAVALAAALAVDNWDSGRRTAGAWASAAAVAAVGIPADNPAVVDKRNQAAAVQSRVSAAAAAAAVH